VSCHSDVGTLFSCALRFGLGSAKGFVAGLGAGAMEATFVTTPQETIKIKLIDDQFRSQGKVSREGERK
jgi:hypothetical protein